MKVIVKSTMAACLLFAGTTAPLSPAYARDGETGYAIGCLIGWLVFGLEGTCGELR